MRLLACLGLVLLLAGCAASGGVQQTSSQTFAIDSSKNGFVKVQSALPDSTAGVDELSRVLNSQLVSRRAFAAMAGDPAMAATRIDVTIQEISQVSQGARILLGALAGQASVKATVNIIDVQTNTVLSSMIANGKSSGGHVFAGTTSEAMDQIASQIVDYILRNRKMGT